MSSLESVTTEATSSTAYPIIPSSLTSLSSTENFSIDNNGINFNTSSLSSAADSMSPVKPTRNEDLAKIEMAVLLVIFTLTLIGNLVVILGIYFRHQKMSRMYYFILHLSIADLVTAFFNVLTQFIMEITWPEFHGGNFLCKFVKYTQILGPYSSSYVLVMTAFDRYQAICFPMQSYKWTTKRSKIMLAIAWLIAVLFCTPQVFIFSIKETYKDVFDCYAEFSGDWGVKTYVTWYSISFFIVPLLLLTFAYTCICRTLWLNANMPNLGKIEFHTNNSTIHTNTSICRLSQSSSSSDEAIHKNRVKNFVNKNRKAKGFFRKNETKELLPDTPKKKIESFTKFEPNNGKILTQVTSPSSPTPSVDSMVQLQHELQQFDNRNVTGRPNSLKGKEENQTKFHNHNGSHNGYANWHHRCDTQNNESKNLLRQDSMNAKNFHMTSSSSPNHRAAAAVNGKDIVPHGVGATRVPSHSSGISRAKIKTIKLTVTVIACYIICSSPFIAAQLWSVYDPYAYQSPFYTGATFTILTLLASLNSCVNPYIFLFFNPNLVQDFFRGFKRNNSRELQRQKSRASGATMRTIVGGSRRLHASPNIDSQFTPKHNFHVDC